MIQITKISKKYRGAERFSIKDLDLQVGEGEIFGLLGPNGAGKTTLISILCSLLRPTSGSFQIDGRDFRTNRRALQKVIGVVPQEYALYPSLTAYENLAYFGSMYDLPKKALREGIHHNLEILGLSEFTHAKIKTYSGGMKRRINLIAGILHNPKVLFLDEPTVGVDVQSRQRILSHLNQLNVEGTTIFYTSHHLNEAENLCTRVGIIDHGRIIRAGRPADLISEESGARHLEDVFLALTGNALRDYA